jgi:hypothetical protein
LLESLSFSAGPIIKWESVSLFVQVESPTNHFR